MTRINAGIPVEKLTDQHLLAEHREIKRIPKMKYDPKNIPLTFRLGKGHVKFFTNKHTYLLNRYVMLYNECIRRGFNVQFYGNSWTDDNIYNSWTPTNSAIKLIEDRIVDRIKSSKCTFRYEGKIIDINEAINLLNKNKNY